MLSETHLYLGSTQDRDDRQEFSSLQQPQPNREVNPRKQVTSGRTACKCNERCAKEKLRSLKKHSAPPWGLWEWESGDARARFREGCFGGDLEAAAARIRLGTFSRTWELASSVNAVPRSRVLQKERGNEERGSDSTPLTACNKLRNWGSETLVAYSRSNC